MRHPNYTLEEDLALVSAYIAFGGNGSIGKIIPYFVEKTKDPYKHKQYSLENRLLVIKKETRNFVFVMGKINRKKESGCAQTRIEYMKIYRKAFPHEETYKLFKYVNGFDYKKFGYEDEEDVPAVPNPTVEIDGENEEGEGERERDRDREEGNEADDEVRVSIHPPYKSTSNVEIEDQQKKRPRGIKHQKEFRRLNTLVRIRRPQSIQFSLKASTKSSPTSKKKMPQSPLLL
ncbi:hypothetical protein MKX01_011947 [Papaver californicum]|nr:hypothetical protein MKX01_011947 [Papaver californicum]